MMSDCIHGTPLRHRCPECEAEDDVEIPEYSCACCGGIFAAGMGRPGAICSVCAQHETELFPRRDGATEKR